MPSTLVIDAHPHEHSFVADLARRYTDAHGDARLLALRDLDFDLHMRFGHVREMPIEPDLAEARTAIRDAAHLTILTPVWWRSVPALLKGFLDRALLPGEDYRYTAQGLPEGLLGGRTGRVVATADTPAALSWVLPDTRLRALRSGTLKFCGISPVQFDYLGSVRTSTPQRREAWLRQVASAAESDALASGARQRPDVAAAVR